MSIMRVLMSNLKGLSFGKYDGLNTCAVPGLFCMENYHGGSIRGDFLNADIFKRIRHKEYGFDRGIVSVKPIQGIGTTEEEALESAAFEILSNQSGLFMHKPKDSDTVEPTVGAKFVTIHNDDRLHEHGSGELVDFSGVLFNPFGGFVEDMPYGRFHAHVMPEQTFLEKVL